MMPNFLLVPSLIFYLTLFIFFATRSSGDWWGALMYHDQNGNVIEKVHSPSLSERFTIALIMTISIPLVLGGVMIFLGIVGQFLYLPIYKILEMLT